MRPRLPSGEGSVSGSVRLGRCHSHAKREAKRKVGVKVRASAAGGRAPPPRRRGACDGQVAPWGPGPVRFLSFRRSRAGIRFASGPGGARSPLWEGPPVTSQRGSCEFKAAGEQARGDLAPPSPWGPGGRSEDSAGPEAPARSTRCHRAQLGQLFLGTIPPRVFGCPVTRLQRFGRKGEATLLVYFLPASWRAHFFVLFKVTQLV